MNYETNAMGLPDLNRGKFKERLPLLFSARIRLDDNQRDKLQQAWRQLRDSQKPAEAAPIPGSTVRVQSTYNLGEMNSVSALTMSEIISSRETISLTTILTLQAEFGIEIVSRAFVEERFTHYLDYIFTTAETYGS